MDFRRTLRRLAICDLKLCATSDHFIPKGHNPRPNELELSSVRLSVTLHTLLWTRMKESRNVIHHDLGNIPTMSHLRYIFERIKSSS